jgi:hypothetical protein
LLLNLFFTIKKIQIKKPSPYLKMSNPFDMKPEFGDSYQTRMSLEKRFDTFSLPNPEKGDTWGPNLFEPTQESSPPFTETRCQECERLREEIAMLRERLNEVEKKTLPPFFN